MRVDGFDWDEGNLSKNKDTRGIESEAIESVFRNSPWVAPDIKHSSKEDRFLAIGRTLDARFMIVAFTFRRKGNLHLIRPISARYMHKREIEKYEKEFSKNEK